MAGGAEYQFVSWTRSGTGALLAGTSQTATIDLGTPDPATASLVPYAPSDVTGLDARAVIRTVPSQGVQDFEPNLFPSVEVAHPGLPWFVSSPADTAGRVMPWISLVVVEDRPGVTLTSTTLSIGAPAIPGNELPPWGQLWAWAHGQASAVEGAPLDTASLRTSGGSARSRLVAPRKLVAATKYIACIVPTTPSWSGNETSLDLAVYYAWRFATGPDGDFASLARRVRPGPLDVSVGHRVVDISSPGWGAPNAAGAALDVPAALRSPAWTPPASQPAAAAAIGAAIAGELDAQASPPPGQPPELAPPSYGAAVTKQDALTSAPAWQRALAVDVAQRIAAAVGADAIRADVDTYVDAAWRSAGDTELVNHAIRRGELAGTLAQALGDKHLGTLASDGELLAIARPLATRMRLDPAAAPTLAATIVASAMPNTALSASLRRLGRAGGPITRKVATTTGDLVARIDAKQIAPAPATQLAAGAAGFDAVSIAAASTARIATVTPALVDSSAAHWSTATTTRALARTTGGVAKIPPGERGTIPTLPSLPGVALPVIDEFRVAARLHQQYITTHLEATPDHRPPLGDVTAARPLARVRAAIAEQWTPVRGILPILGSRIGAPISTFAPLAATPVLERPLIQTLAARAPELVMPGFESLHANRAAIAITDQTFVRALLVGANEQLARELLWRRYPGALGHTWLRTFWGRVAVAADGSIQRVADIPPIETWPADPPTIPDMLVLAVRADVLHRYPNALVYAVAATWQGTHRVVGTSPELAPVVATTLGPDIAVFGFALDQTTARGTTAPPGAAGYYFVIAEHPHEPRFGLAASAIANPTSWRDVAWSDLAAGDLAGPYLRVDGPLAQRTIAQLRWGTDAGTQAAITLRPTIRVAIHASTLM